MCGRLAARWGRPAYRWDDEARTMFPADRRLGENVEPDPGAIPLWIGHWGLERDPFAEPDSPYVSLPSHDEAVARLVHIIETSQRCALVTAATGLGKTTVLRRAFVETQAPRRRFAAVSCPPDVTLLFALLAERLGERIGREPDRLGSWRALERAIRVATLEACQIILAIDDCDHRGARAVRRELDSLVRLGSNFGANLTIIQLERARGDVRSDWSGAWTLTIGLRALTRSQAESYLATKLKAAGCTGPVFTPRAITRLHGLCSGIPRGLEQLASLSLIAGAVRGLEVISPDLVDGVARECRHEAHAWGGDDCAEATAPAD
jgi:type II secretory pathway predicted ATPase ExeA